MLLCGALTLGLTSPFAAQTVQPAARSRAPKLIVLISIDQMRGDYIDKYQHQWSKGLKRLIAEGAWFRSEQLHGQR